MKRILRIALAATLTVAGEELTGLSLWKKGEKAPKEYWVKASLKK